MKGIATNDPTAAPSRATPRDPADRESEPLTAGMRDAQAAETSPSMKKTATTARRARVRTAGSSVRVASHTGDVESCADQFPHLLLVGVIVGHQTLQGGNRADVPEGHAASFVASAAAIVRRDERIAARLTLASSGRCAVTPSAAPMPQQPST